MKGRLWKHDHSEEVLPGVSGGAQLSQGGLSAPVPS